VLDANGKLFGKLNYVDLIFLLALAAALAVVVRLATAPKPAVGDAHHLIVTTYATEMPDYAAGLLTAGSILYDSTHDVVLGEILSVEVNHTPVYGIDSEGIVSKQYRSDEKAVEIKSIVEGSYFETGFLIGGFEYGVGQRSTFAAAGATFSGQIKGVESAD